MPDFIKIIYVYLLIMGIIWFYRMYSKYRKKENSFNNDYYKILNSDEYKVKGKFEN